MAIFWAVCADPAGALTYTDAFPSEDSTVVASAGVIGSGQYGWFWSVARGENITENFTGTGLDEVFQLDLNFEITYNNLVAGDYTEWDVLINGNSVGGWTWTYSMGLGVVDASYSFAPIAGAGNYALRMEIVNEVPPHHGSIAIGFPGEMVMHGSSTGVPDTGSTLVLLTSVLMGLGVLRQRLL